MVKYGEDNNKIKGNKLTKFPRCNGHAHTCLILGAETTQIEVSMLWIVRMEMNCNLKRNWAQFSSYLLLIEKIAKILSRFVLSEKSFDVFILLFEVYCTFRMNSMWL